MINKFTEKDKALILNGHPPIENKQSIWEQKIDRM